MSPEAQSLRIIFAGTPDFAAEHLNVLLKAGHQVIAAYSQPDRPAGRGKKLTASPVKQVAIEHGIPVYQPINFKEEGALDQLQALEADLMIVVAYGLLLPQSVLDTPRLGCINVHASILPRWRGAAPIQRAIEAGDLQSGVTIMQMDAGLDTGDMLIKAFCDITPEDTGGSLHDKLQDAGGPALLATLEQLALGTAKPEAQPDTGSTYAKKITKQECLIDWTRSASALDLAIRAFNPFPVCFTLQGKDRIRVWQATPSEKHYAATAGTIVALDNEQITVACGQGSLNITQLQLPGKKALSAADVIRGHADRFAIGSDFTGAQE